MGDRQVKRKLGTIRTPGSSEGITRKQAEAALRRKIGEVKILAPKERVTFQDAAERYVHHVEHVLKRKPSTVQDYGIMVHRHLAPHFPRTAIDRITADDVAAYIGMGERCGRKGGITFHSLRHTFGTRMGAVGVPMRTLQEWMGHRDFTTTLIYADFAPDPAGGAAFAERAFGGLVRQKETDSASAPSTGGRRELPRL